MNKIYCMSCSQPTEFLAIKPKFCGECGQSFIATASAAPAPPKPSLPKFKPKQAPVVDDDEDEIEDEDQTPSVSDLDPNAFGVEVEVQKFKGEKIEDIISSATTLGARSEALPKRNLPKPPAKKQIWADFRKDAGTSRPK